MDSQTALGYLNSQRHHVLGILDGLDDEALRKPVLPSGWSCLGLVRHLAVDVERFWFLAVVGADQAVIDEFAASPDDGWQVDPGVPAKAVLDFYREQIDLANAVIIATPLNEPPAWWPGDQFGDWRMDDLHEIILHVMVETACHAGHLDAVRELLDGRQWRVLTD